MAVIQDDANAVGHMLNRTPSSIAEVDVFGQTPFHLAATNPRILTLLLKYKDCHILDRRDGFGFTALEIAMMRSSDYCDNGRNTNRCHGENRGCCLCVDLFIGAQCNVRMYVCTIRTKHLAQLHYGFSCHRHPNSRGGNMLIT